MITFTPEEFRSIVSVGVASSDDAITPVITGVNIEVDENGYIIATATDRYRIARSQFMPHHQEDGYVGEADSILIPAKELTRFWNSIKADAMKHQQIVSLTILTGDNDNKKYVLEYTVSGVRVEGHALKGNFPPVGKLMIGFEKENCDGVPVLGLNPNYIADLVKMFHPRDGRRINVKQTPWEFRFKSGSSGGKSGPIYITRKGDAMDGIFDYLVQPNLLLR